MSYHSGTDRRDVLVVGDGIIGMCVAIQLARRGRSCTVLGERLPGAATLASGGLLAPSLGHASGHLRAMLNAGRDRYPSFLAELRASTGVRVPLRSDGILEVGADSATVDELISSAPGGSRALTAGEVAALEPSLAPVAGGVLHPQDGSVEVEILMSALDGEAERLGTIQRLHTLALAIEPGDTPVVRDVRGQLHRANVLVLAAGAWVSRLEGLPRRVPVAPLRGQMVSVDGSALRHPVFGFGGYAVPRNGWTVAGSTSEDAGYDATATDAACALLRRRLGQLSPALASAPERARWAGLRPATPDLLPIIGRDPEYPSVVYASGHSRNGILLGPVTGDWVASLIVGDSPPSELAAFSITRFSPHAVLPPPA